jgi:hypothetical protein
MLPSPLDPCLLHSSLGIVGLQTDDTLCAGTAAFIENENAAIVRSKLLSKPIELLSTNHPIEFNGAQITKDSRHSYYLSAAKHVKKLKPIEIGAADSVNDDYVTQRARGAYISTVCQPQVAFGLLSAAQATEPSQDDV